MQRAERNAARGRPMQRGRLSLRRPPPAAATTRAVGSRSDFSGKNCGSRRGSPGDRGRRTAARTATNGFGTPDAFLFFRRGIPVPGRHQVLARRLGSPTSFGRAVALPLTRMPMAGRSCRVGGPSRTCLGRPSRRRPSGLAEPAAGAFSGADSGPRLDSRPGAALLLRFGRPRPRPLAGGFRPVQIVIRQRSFNWQSTAFVMRGLWVRFPPLALTGS